MGTKPAAAVTAALAALKRRGNEKTRIGMSTRFGIVGPTAETAFGVPMASIHKVAKDLGRDHQLAAALWATGQYEARMLACFVDEPARVTAAQMDGWCRDFDNWAVCDTACFHLFDRVPVAYGRAAVWAQRKAEFVRRGGFALMACLALHDKQADDDAFWAFLPLVEAGAGDERNFVKKGVSWALRSIGRRGPALHSAGLDLAGRLADSDEPARRWVGKDAVRDLSRVKVRTATQRR